MFCHNCGCSLPASVKFCMSCGAAQSHSKSQETVNTAELSESTASPPTITASKQEPQMPVYWPPPHAPQSAPYSYAQPASNSRSILLTVVGVIIGIAVLYFAVTVVVPSLTGEVGLAGTWTRTQTSGNIPASTPTQIVFTGEGSSGSGHFTDAFWGTRVNFTWSIGDTFFMSRIPGGEGIIGFTGYTLMEVNAARNRITFRYPNGSSAVFTRR